MPNPMKEKVVSPKALDAISDKQQSKKFIEEKSKKILDEELYKSPFLQEKLREFMKELPKQERAILELRFWENKNFDEISQELRIQRRTVEKVLNTAIEALRLKFISFLGR